MTASNIDQSVERLVEHADRLGFEAEARRQSIAIVRRRRDPRGAGPTSLDERAALLDADHFAFEWKA